MRTSRHSPVLVGALAGAVFSIQATATWSIIIIDTTTREIAVGSATCLTDRDLLAFTPVVVPLVGAATAQALGDSTQLNRSLIHDRLLAGSSPAQILAELSTFDATQHQTRQYGIANIDDAPVTFSGASNSAWAGGRTGAVTTTITTPAGTRVHELIYAVQGNILTGPQVADAAVAAITSSTADLPRRLMDAMQAARSFGGDGRCSCAPDSATACGAPPPSFTKSAHVGYMIVARAGDAPAAQVLTSLRGNAAALAIADLDADRLPELLFSIPQRVSVSLSRNASPPAGLGHAFAAPELLGVGSGPQLLAVADANADARADIIVYEQTSATISWLPQLEGSAWGSRISTPQPDPVSAMVAGKFDSQPAPDLALLVRGQGVQIRRNDGAGTFAPPATIPITGDLRALVCLDVNSDSRPDLLVTDRSAARIAVLLSQGDGTFVPAPDIPTPPFPTFLAAGDVDADGHDDLAVFTQAAIRRITPILWRADGWATQTSTDVPSNSTALALGDVTGDGRADAVLPAGTSFTMHAATPDAFFGLPLPTPTNWTLGQVALADLDNDSHADAVFTLASPSAYLVVTGTPAGFSTRLGLSTADYFLTLNVPNQPATAPDPVDQLQQQFDAWRATNRPRADAIISRVSGPIDAPTPSARSFLVELLTAEGSPRDLPPDAVRPRLAEPRAGYEVSPARRLAPGLYEFNVAFARPLSTISIHVDVLDPLGTVRLMPDAVLPHIVCPADFIPDNAATPDDLIAYLGAFLAGDPAADLTADLSVAIPDGAVTIDDLVFFLAAFEAGCHP